LSLNKKVTKEVSIGEALNGLLISAPRAAFGGCAPKRACGRSRNPIRPLLCTSPGAHYLTAQHLNGRKFQTYGLAIGGGS